MNEPVYLLNMFSDYAPPGEVEKALSQAAIVAADIHAEHRTVHVAAHSQSYVPRRVVETMEREVAALYGLARLEITLTHPEIIRYFMTIPEAASLVLQAASIARGGELFVLDMGRPVKIRELAERMIQLYAPENGQKIEIVYTGLRPGEKLYEELLLDGEGISRTENRKIFIAKPEQISVDRLEAMLDTLRQCIEEGGDMRACLHELVPTFREPQQVNQNHAEAAESVSA